MLMFDTFGNQSGSDEVVRSQMNMRRKSRAEVKYGDPYEWGDDDDDDGGGDDDSDVYYTWTWSILHFK